MKKVITIRQPWAYSIFHGKRIENRSWTTNYRGELWIHASAKTSTSRRDFDLSRRWIEDKTGLLTPDYESTNFGAILGRVNLVDCVEEFNSPWFVGRFGWVLENPQQLK